MVRRNFLRELTYLDILFIVSVFPEKYFAFKTIRNIWSSSKKSLCIFRSQCLFFFLVSVFWFSRFFKYMNLVFQVYLFFEHIIYCNNTTINFSFKISSCYNLLKIICFIFSLVTSFLLPVFLITCFCS